MQRTAEIQSKAHGVSRGVSLVKLAGWLALFAALLISRWALAPRFLITFDEINFALSIEHFDPKLHQPQPPGYPLFVGLLKMLSFILPNVETVFIFAALLISAISLLLLRWLCGMIAGPSENAIAPLLLLFNPAFWLSSLTNPVRLSEAAGAVAVAGCAWMACSRASAQWFWLAAAGLGFFAGLRPTIAIVVAPLVLWAAWQIRARWSVLGIALLCFVAGVATWLPALVAAFGGWRPFVDTLGNYSGNEFAEDSVFFGAPLYSVLRMAWRALVWSCLGVISWLWILPFLARRTVPALAPRAAQFLALWFFPGLLFFATVHVGDPDHTLSIVPPTCIAGALAVAAFTRGSSPAKRTVVIATCVLINGLMFFRPMSRTARASSYYAVQSLERDIAHILEDTEILHAKGPGTVVFHESTTGWRQLSYYDPQAHIIVVMRGDGGSVVERHILGRQAIERISPDGIVSIPACNTVAWIDPGSSPISSTGARPRALDSMVFLTPVASGELFDFRGFHFAARREDCDKIASGPQDR